MLAFLLLVVVPALVAAGGAHLFGRRAAVADGERDGDSVSYVGGIVSALFTVVLAFFVVFAWQASADVEASSGTESDALLDLFWQVEALPAAQRVAMQDVVAQYTRQVADTEWPMLARGQSDQRAAELLDKLRTDVGALPVDGGVSEAVREQGMADLRQIADARRARVGSATDGDPFTTVLLVGTLVGGALTIAFPLLAGISARPGNIVIMGLLGLVVGLTLFVAVELAYPVGGLFGAEPGAYLGALTEMSTAD
ncbi:hypothetical protein ACQEVB_31145 [Pseudonocardia sp. CA-107938]|uniref:bestrophin-like domain n=1 Tax=Pseudonocardia sp. CA-107938 TaxID=3240021 RepID=UPI003D8ECCCF